MHQARRTLEKHEEKVWQPIVLWAITRFPQSQPTGSLFLGPGGWGLERGLFFIGKWWQQVLFTSCADWVLEQSSLALPRRQSGAPAVLPRLCASDSHSTVNQLSAVQHSISQRDRHETGHAHFRLSGRVPMVIPPLFFSLSLLEKALSRSAAWCSPRETRAGFAFKQPRACPQLSSVFFLSSALVGRVLPECFRAPRFSCGRRFRQ